MNIKDLRLKTMMTQKEFAEYFNIPKRTIENWEGGRRKPPAYVVELIKYKIDNERMKEKQQIINNLKEDKTIEQLQEVGKINIDYIDEDIYLLMEALEEGFNIKTDIKDQVGGRYLVIV